MLLIIGLGNPGEEYARTRHNAGFLLLDEIRKVWNFPAFGFEKKFNAEISEGNCKIQDTSYKKLLVKPQAFMNNSGEAVRKLLDFYKLTPTDIIVIHDDLDLEIGKYKISTDSSAAGHNGVRDIIDKLGTQNFKRIRIGVETSGGRTNRLIPGEDFVLQNFTAEEAKPLLSVQAAILKELASILYSS